MNDRATIFVDPTIAFENLGRSAEVYPAGRGAFFFLCLFTVAIYARPEDIFPAIGQLHLTLLLGVCALASYAAAWFSGSAPLLGSRELRLMLWLTAWFVAGVPFAFWRGGSFQVLTQTWIKTLLVFFLLTQTLLTIKRIQLVLWAIILSELAVSSYSILNPSESRWIGDRLAGVNQGILGWNFLGTAAAITIPFIAALFISNASFIKSVVLAAATAAMMWMLVLTASRSGIIMVAFSFLATWLFVLRHNSRGKLIGIGLMAVMVLAMCAAPGVFWQRIQTIWNNATPTTVDAASADASEQDRQELLIRGIQYTIAHPVFGVGLGNFEAVSGAELGNSENSWSGTHNTFVQISSEAGIPALIIFVALLAVSIRRMWRIARAEDVSPEVNGMARATLVSLLACVVGALFAHIAYEYYLYYPIAIAAAVTHLSFAMRSVTPAPSDDQQAIDRKLGIMGRVQNV
jgi:O-antigen ligase